MRLLKAPDGSVVVMDKDGKMRPAEKSELAKVRLNPPKNQQGVSYWERFVLKNFADSPESARQYLRSRGYWVSKFGTGLNFAVQKARHGDDGSVVDPDPQAWKVVDPSPEGRFYEDFTELVADVSDFTTDILTGFAAASAGTAGASLGPLGAVAGAGLAGAGAEVARQVGGKALGVPQDVDLKTAGFVGAASGVTQGALSALGGVARLATKGGQVLGLRALSMGNRSRILDREQLKLAALLEKFKHEVNNPEDLLIFLRNKIAHASGEGFPEMKILMGTLRAAEKAGRKINIGPAVKAIARKPAPASILGKEAADRGNAVLEDLAVDLSTELGRGISLETLVPGVTAGGRLMVSPVFAQEWKKSLQFLVSDLGGYTLPRTRGALGKAKDFVSNLDTAERAIRAQLGKHIPGYTAANKVASPKMAALSDARGIFGDHKLDAERHILTVFDSGNTPRLRVIQEFDSQFNTDFGLKAADIFGPPNATEILARFKGGRLTLQDRFALTRAGASINENVQEFGTPRFLPRLTPTGQFLGASAFGGATVGGVLGGGLGGDLQSIGAGAAIGAGLASPVSVLGLTRAGLAAGRLTATVPARGAATGARTALMATLQASTRQIKTQTSDKTNRPVVRLQ